MLDSEGRRVVHSLLQDGRIEGPNYRVLPDRFPRRPIIDEQFGVKSLEPPGVEARATQHGVRLLCIRDDLKPPGLPKAFHQLLAE